MGGALGWLWFILIGLASGVVSGLGIGGGTILIPALVFLFGMDQHAAQKINLIYFVPTAAVALITHFRNKNVEVRPLPVIVIAGVIGAAAGSLVAVRMDGDVLKKIFGVFLFLMGIYEVFKKKEN